MKRATKNRLKVYQTALNDLGISRRPSGSYGPKVRQTVDLTNWIESRYPASIVFAESRLGNRRGPRTTVHEMMAWLDEQKIVYQTIARGDEIRFYFLDEDTAMLFKLAWQ